MDSKYQPTGDELCFRGNGGNAAREDVVRGWGIAVDGDKRLWLWIAHSSLLR